ncbi:MAG TPA: hypothetical protein VHK69_07100 [Chitinophagaceae bacterium]|nr:hypothetical protein [Chitinophagaceae bacterium]
MKRWILCASLFLALSGAAMAQTGSGSSSNGPSVSPGAASAKKGNNKKSSKKQKSVDHRKNYRWKSGQTATPTGEEATSSNGNSYSAPRKDTSGNRRQRR